jgi:hypothetical protein
MMLIINDQSWRVIGAPKSWKRLTEEPACMSCRQTLTVAYRGGDPFSVGCKCARRPMLSTETQTQKEGSRHLVTKLNADPASHENARTNNNQVS